MRSLQRAAIQGLTLLLVGICAPASAQTVLSALADPGRPPGDLARDAARKPGDILAFSGIKAGDRILELVPGDGYFTRLLSKLIGARGRVYSYVPIVGDAQAVRTRERAATLKGETLLNPVDQALAIQNVQPGYANVMVLWEEVTTLAAPEQVDVVFLVDAYQRIGGGEFGTVDRATFNKGVFTTLKPGGMFFVVDNAATATAMRNEVIAAGFIVEGAAGDGRDVAVRYRKPAASVRDQRPRSDPLKAWYGNTFIVGTPTERSRTIFHHPDNTYQEFGASGMQSGVTFWAADGRNCMLRQFPVEQRGYVTCRQYPTSDVKKIGEMWIEGGPNHLMQYKEGAPVPAAGQGAIVGLMPGYIYPGRPSPGRGEAPARGVPPPRVVPPPAP